MKDATDALREFSASAELGYIILRANGPVFSAFSAGHDLKEMIGRSLEKQHIFALCIELMETVQQLPQPVIAAVQGQQWPQAVNLWPPATWLSPARRPSSAPRE